MDPIAIGVLDGRFPEGHTIVVDTDGGDALTFHSEPSAHLQEEANVGL